MLLALAAVYRAAMTLGASGVTRPLTGTVSGAWNIAKIRLSSFIAASLAELGQLRRCLPRNILGSVVSLRRRGLSFEPGNFGLTGRASGLSEPPGRDPEGRPFWNLLNLPDLSRGGFLNFAMLFASASPRRALQALQTPPRSSGVALGQGALLAGSTFGSAEGPLSGFMRHEKLPGA